MYYVSEIFKSIQGEGHYTGVPTVWVRTFGCNLECNGFGQDEPTKPETYELPYKTLDISEIKNVKDLPVFSKGCDSSYSWSKKYRHLLKKLSAQEVKNTLVEYLPGDAWNSNPAGTDFHLAITGGEPLMRKGQKLILELLEEFKNSDAGVPKFVTFETNGTQALIPELKDYIKNSTTEFFFSVSPKIYSVSGEPASKAIKPEVLKEYIEVSKTGQLKFVADGSNRAWEEIFNATKLLDPDSVYSRWVMPVGATLEEQETNAGDIANQAIDYGYNVSARVHCYLFGNQIGT